LPDNVPANEFLNLEGDKISTSRNWAVWLHEYLEDFPGKEDVLRYVLCANAPETKDNDFTWKDFQARNNNELVAIFGNFVNRSLVLTQNYFGGVVPEPGLLTAFDEKMWGKVASIKTNVEDALETFRFREALKEAMSLARLGNKYLADTEPWKLIKTDEPRVKTILNISLQVTANLALLMEPFLPKTSAALREMLNLKHLDWEVIGSTLLATGHKINVPTLLFDKIDDAAIELQLERLKRIKAENASKNAKAAPQKENINFDDFSKMDIRVGTILEAEKVAKTTKLMKLLVDTGIDKRVIVSGIAEHFTPEQIIGKQVSVLVNLEPRKIKGTESQGMLLLAEDFAGKLILVGPQAKTDNGGTIK
jgi:methionyl-tRNA synthetase